MFLQRSEATIGFLLGIDVHAFCFLRVRGLLAQVLQANARVNLGPLVRGMSGRFFQEYPNVGVVSMKVHWDG